MCICEYVVSKKIMSIVKRKSQIIIPVVYVFVNQKVLRIIKCLFNH